MYMQGIRLLTALTIVGACALAVSRGSDIIRFSMAEAGFDPTDNPSEVLRPWVTVSGLAFSARESSLTALTAPVDKSLAAKRRDQLTELLSVRPLSPGYWLSLSRMRLNTDQNSIKVVEALAFSSLIGADEGYIMFQRGLFGVSQWEVLPPEVQKRTVIDLIAQPLGYGELGRLRSVLSEKTEMVRQEIRTALQTQGFPAKDLVTIGL